MFDVRIDKRTSKSKWIYPAVGCMEDKYLVSINRNGHVPSRWFMEYHIADAASVCSDPTAPPI